MEHVLLPRPVGGQMVDLHKILAGENLCPVLPGKRHTSATKGDAQT